MTRRLGGPIAMAALVSAIGYAGEVSSRHVSLRHDSPAGASLEYAADRAGRCGAVRLSETTVATLHNAPIVTVSANGAAVTLLLDTGAEATILTPAVAQRIGAQRPRIEFERRMHGITGSLPTGEVELRSFTIGGIEIPWQRVRVAPIDIASPFSGPLDGVLGADTLSSFDLDLDLPGHRMTLYDRQTCAGAAPAWSEPYVRIAAGRSPGDRLFFPVQLDGHRTSALIDTGAQFSVLSTRTALALGVTEAALAHDPIVTVRGVVAEQLSGRIHRFSRLEVGGETIGNPEIDVADIRLSEADLVLGIDFLRSRRIWMSYGSQQIFLLRRT
jgi:predicted aspartyl protease